MSDHKIHNQNKIYVLLFFYSVYSESVLTAEYLFLYGIKVTEQLDVLRPCMDYAENDGKQ